MHFGSRRFSKIPTGLRELDDQINHFGRYTACTGQTTLALIERKFLSTSKMGLCREDYAHYLRSYRDIVDCYKKLYYIL